MTSEREPDPCLWNWRLQRKRTGFAVECDPEGISLIRQNGEKFGCHNLTAAVEGDGAGCSDGAACAGCCFYRRNEGGRLDPILDAIPGKTDPSVSSTGHHGNRFAGFTVYEKKNMRNMDACQIGVTRLRPVGGLHMLQAQNPIFLLWGGI